MGAESAWTRYPRTKTAVRGSDDDRITLMQQRDQWTAFVGTESVILSAEADADLDSVIDLVDQIYLPAGWAYDPVQGEAWVRPGWACVPEEDGAWRVLRTDVPGVQEGTRGIPASSKTFKSADRARRWAEVRLDRTTLNLRGPRPRATQRANMTLPDVRVTEGERAAAVDLANRLGMSYSDLARAALDLVAREADGNGRLTLVRTGNKISLNII